MNLFQTLAMPYAGAGGDTERQMAQVMHYDLAQNALHSAIHHLTKQWFTNEKDFEFSAAYAVWVQEGYPIHQEYIDLMAGFYKAGLRRAHFEKDPDAPASEINQWVKEQTRGKIQNIVGPRDINPLTRLILTGAIYFMGKWVHQFDPGETGDARFQLLNRKRVMVPTMWITKYFRYAKSESFHALELPYSGERLTMLILLPDRGGLKDLVSNVFGSFEKKLNHNLIRNLLGKLEQDSVEVSLGLPKFELEATLDAGNAFAEMGMTDAFDQDKADFSAIFPKGKWAIDRILHKAYVKVDEQGTETAAITEMAFLADSMESEKIIFHVDRPFVSLIVDRETQAVLFLGSVVNPAEEKLDEGTAVSDDKQ